MEETGKKLIDRTGKLVVQVEIDWDEDNIIVSVDKNTNIATVMYALLLGYNSAYMQATDALDSTAPTTLQ